MRMSHLDELDEFEAKLELELKREYTAVFGLFRYCILTQDATYLCNKLDLKVVPQASYPFFHITMEDVWVWDKNRPTRIIPRAEVYTSSDVTVEELRGEGDEPKLTAEALAERIGETLSSDDEQLSGRLLARRRCWLAVLAVDVGQHTDGARALRRGPKLTEHWRLATERERTGDELGVLLNGLLDEDSVDGVCLASTVPALIREWERLAERWLEAPLLVVGPGTKTGIPIRYDDPREVGPGPHRQRRRRARAARGPCIVVDFGTSTNFDVVSARGGVRGRRARPGRRDLDGGALRRARRGWSRSTSPRRRA